MARDARPAGGLRVPVAHPVLYRYRPPRVRIDRHGYGAGVTPVTLRPLEERPRPAGTCDGRTMLEAEGTLWTPLAAGSAPLPPSVFAEFLANPSQGGPGRKAFLGWADRSPILHAHPVLPREERLAAPLPVGRVGELDVSGAAFVDDGADRAARSVRAFLDDRVRIDGDRVLVREERLVCMDQIDRARPNTSFRQNPRGQGGDFYKDRICPFAIRPDRLASAWDLSARKMKGPVPEGPWGPLAGARSDLLRDDDLEWNANRLPAYVLAHMRSSWYRERTAEADPEPHRRLLDELARYERLGRTGDVVGDLVEPALRAAEDALTRMAARRMQVRVDSDGEAKAYLFLVRMVRYELLPRAAPPHPADEADLAGLAPA